MDKHRDTQIYANNTAGENLITSLSRVIITQGKMEAIYRHIPVTLDTRSWNRSSLALFLKTTEPRSCHIKLAIALNVDDSELERTEIIKQSVEVGRDMVTLLIYSRLPSR